LSHCTLRGHLWGVGDFGKGVRPRPLDPQMGLHLLHSVPPAVARMGSGTLGMNIPTGPLKRIRLRTGGWYIQPRKARRGSPPRLDLLRLVECGVVDHEREAGEGRRGRGAIECLQ